MVYTNEDIKQKMIRKKRIKTAFKIIFLPILAIIFILVGYISYMKYIKHETDINIFGFREYVVSTGSMEPNYNVGDLIIVKEQKKDDIKVDDVINFKIGNGNETVTHRVTEIVEKDGETYYKTKGDNNSSEDVDLVKANQIQGTVVFKINQLGAILMNLLTETGILIIFVVVILSYIRTNRKEERRIAREDARKLYNVPKYEKGDIV